MPRQVGTSKATPLCSGHRRGSHWGLGGEGSRRPAPACSPPKVQMRRSPPALLWPRPWALPAGRAHEQREKQEVLFPTEGSFRPLLALSTALEFDARHPTLPGRRPTWPFPAGVEQAGNRRPHLHPSAASPRARPWGPRKEGVSRSSGRLHPRGARSPYIELLRPSSRPGHHSPARSLQMHLFWTFLINGHEKCVLLCLLLSLTIMCSRSIHDVACVRASLLFMVSHTPPYTWTTC